MIRPVGKKVAFCVPTIRKPHQECLDALAASVPLLQAAGWDDYMVSEVGNPYISCARAFMIRKALDAGADVIVCIDHDLSWDAHDLLTLIETKGDVVAGTYRFKNDKEEYMGALLPGPDGYPQVRDDGAVKAHCAPAGFLKLTRQAVNTFALHYPELCFGERIQPHVDLFNHGAHEHVWYGEDYSFCRRWNDKCGEMWIVPDLNLTHHGDKAYPGNYHNWLLRQSGGSDSANPRQI